MPIISISLDNETLKEIEEIEKEIPFSSRSDAIRSAIRSKAAENRKLGELKGRVKGVLLITHAENADSSANDFKHAFDDVIDTQIHTRHSEGKCLEIFIFDGEAGRIAEMMRAAQADRKIGHVKFVVP
ncbi:MAG: ribbon-helix-helix protein, CopG family [Candidatus Micrarchaeia archaeon]